MNNSYSSHLVWKGFIPIPILEQNGNFFIFQYLTRFPTSIQILFDSSFDYSHRPKVLENKTILISVSIYSFHLLKFLVIQSNLYGFDLSTNKQF